jgi:hypothetical protein
MPTSPSALLVSYSKYSKERMIDRVYEQISVSSPNTQHNGSAPGLAPKVNYDSRAIDACMADRLRTNSAAFFCPNFGT